MKFRDMLGREHDHGPEGLWPCLEPYFEKKRAIERAGGEVEMHRVTVCLSVVLSENEIEAAKQSVLETLEFEDYTFGAPGQMLPFQLEGIEAMPITEEDIGRP